MLLEALLPVMSKAGRKECLLDFIWEEVGDEMRAEKA